ncbi:MAG TPA: succinylglutamate desuccinylase/aspartoacylase family protein [Opitutus sp.]|nr:succinylglutamate desuccinylase/aspartoacylase family protein [Opitutus sp.]
MPVSVPSFTSDVRNAGALPAPLRALLESCVAKKQSEAEVELRRVGRFVHESSWHEILCLRLAGPYAGHDPIRLGLFAGIHGDEPAGTVALVQFARALAEDPARAAGYDLYLYPVVNPVGCERGTRANRSGKDLNREFWQRSGEAEVQAIEAELRQHRFDGIITLHTDDTSEGLYGYAHGRTLNEALLAPALEAAKAFLPLDGRAIIDGFPARGALICDCFTGVLSAPPEQRPQPFDLIFETPGTASLDLQVAATVAALDSIIRTYPGFIAYAQDL